MVVFSFRCFGPRPLRWFLRSFEGSSTFSEAVGMSRVVFVVCLGLDGFDVMLSILRWILGVVSLFSVHFGG